MLKRACISSGPDAAAFSSHLLAHLEGARPPAPDWFERALEWAPERTQVQVEGAHIETLAWGRVGAPGILLLHGNAAHADWYSFIAPLLASRFRVAAMSWSGMGGSDWRAPSQYSAALHALEALTAARAAGLFESSERPVFVAHSFGTFPLIAAAATFGEQLGGALLLDSPLRSPKTRQAEAGARAHRERRSPPTYATVTEALARFRLIPPQPCEHLYLVDHIARTGLKPVGDGDAQRWSWRFDPDMFRSYDLGHPASDLAQARCRIGLVRGALSTVADADNFAYARLVAPPGSVAREIPNARHHVMLDEPVALAETIAEFSKGFLY